MDTFGKVDTMGRMGSGSGDRRTRRQFSDEFKTGAIRLVLDEGKTVGAVARELDLTRLRKEVRELRMERDVLKTAAAFFAKDHL